MRPETADFRLDRTKLRPERFDSRPDLKPERAGLRSERPKGGEEQTNGRMNK